MKSSNNSNSRYRSVFSPLRKSGQVLFEGQEYRKKREFLEDLWNDYEAFKQEEQKASPAEKELMRLHLSRIAQDKKTKVNFLRNLIGSDYSGYNQGLYDHKDKELRLSLTPFIRKKNRTTQKWENITPPGVIVQNPFKVGLHEGAHQRSAFLGYPNREQYNEYHAKHGSLDTLFDALEPLGGAKKAYPNKDYVQFYDENNDDHIGKFDSDEIEGFANESINEPFINVASFSPYARETLKIPYQTILNEIGEDSENNYNHLKQAAQNKINSLNIQSPIQDKYEEAKSHRQGGRIGLSSMSKYFGIM